MGFYIFIAAEYHPLYQIASDSTPMPQWYVGARTDPQKPGFSQTSRIVHITTKTTFVKPLSYPNWARSVSTKLQYCWKTLFICFSNFLDINVRYFESEPQAQLIPTAYFQASIIYLYYYSVPICKLNKAFDKYSNCVFLCG